MTFEVHKVVDNFCEDWVGKKVYYADDLINLMMYVEGKKEEEPAKVYGKGSATNPFGVETAMGDIDVWKYIYPAEEKQQEEKYRPFESVAELIERWYSINSCPTPICTMPLIWVKYKTPLIDVKSTTRQLITAFANTGVEMGAEFMSWKYLFENMEFLDGTPCGVKI